MSTPDRITVSVAYADAQRQIVRAVALDQGARVADAIRCSGIAAELPADFRAEAIGVFGRRVSESTLLRDGDRVELYRPLRVDPKQARRRRAESQR